MSTTTGADTALDLAAIQARADAASKGPWEPYSVPATRKESDYVAVEAGDTEIRIARFEGGWFDAEFIAHARTDVPALLDRVRQLEADLADAHRDAMVNRDTANRAHEALANVRFTAEAHLVEGTVVVIPHRILLLALGDAGEEQ